MSRPPLATLCLILSLFLTPTALAQTSIDKPKLTGSRTPDTLEGTPGNDRLIGKAGNDTLHGHAGRDRLKGGAGDDTLYGGNNRDRLNGGDGNDMLAGQRGHDVLQGGPGTDTLEGGIGNDTLNGGPDPDTLTGGPGIDSFHLLDPESTPENADRITDFDPAKDRLIFPNGTTQIWFEHTPQGPTNLYTHPDRRQTHAILENPVEDLGTATVATLDGTPIPTITNLNSRKPNIVLILVDDLGTDWIPAYGSGVDINLPHLDRLARQGMLFNNAYSMPKCTPTRMTIMTGQYPYQHGWIRHWSPATEGGGTHFDWNEFIAFPRLLKQAGYTTAIAGKWQLTDFRVQPDALNQHGFDDYFVWPNRENGINSATKGKSGKRYWSPYIYSDGKYKKYPSDVFGPDLYTQFLLDFITKNKNQPFFAYYSMALTHSPYTYPPHIKDKVTEANPLFDPRGLAHVKSAHDKKQQVNFLHMIEYMDKLVGRFIDTLDTLKIRDNTLILWTTDNGTGLNLFGNRHGREIPGGKDSLKEAGINVPFIASMPGTVPQGIKTNALTDFTDLYPTFAELAGAKISNKNPVAGKSLVPVLSGQSKLGPRKWILAMGGAFAKYNPITKRVENTNTYAGRALRNHTHKAYVDKTARIHQLFNLKADPFEETNLLTSTKTENTQALQEFQKIIATFPKQDAQRRYTPLNNPYFNLTFD